MISRIVDLNVRPGRLNEFRRTLNDKFISRIKSQPGFVDIIESVDPSSGHFVRNTFWKSTDDVKGYDSGLFQERACALSPYLATQATVSTLTVENSSVHRITAGRSAAA